MEIGPEEAFAVVPWWIACHVAFRSFRRTAARPATALLAAYSAIMSVGVAVAWTTAVSFGHTAALL